MSDGRRRLRLRIEGFVQGVAFRASARREAALLGVSGTVCNLPDGSVEAVIEGDAGAVDRMLDWCRHGPRGAEVTNVEIVEEPYRGEFASFRVTG
jgi:acylphosphatase